MSYYSRIHELILVESLFSQGYTQEEINEVLTIGGIGGKALGLGKRVLGGKEDFIQGYNAMIDRSNALRKARGQEPRLYRWGEGPSSRTDVKPDGKPDVKSEPKSKASRLSPEEYEKKRQADRTAGLERQRQMHGGRSLDPALNAEGARRAALNIKDFDLSTLRKADSNKGIRPGVTDIDKEGKPIKLASRQQAQADLLALNAGRFARMAQQRREAGLVTAPRDPKIIAQAQKDDIKKAKEKGKNPLAALTAPPNKDTIDKIKKSPYYTPYDTRADLSLSTYYGDVANLIRESFQLNEKKKGPCWKGYEAIGMKMKGGRKVPNCVPKSK